MKRVLGAGVGVALALGVASAAQAGPVTYTQTIDHVTLRMPAPIGPKTDVTVTLVAQADTASIVASGNVFGLAGKCVLASSATITVTGVPTQTFVSPIYVCATNIGERAGFYTAAGGGANEFLIGSPSAYVIDLDQATNSTYMASDIRPGAARPAIPDGDVVFNYMYATHQTFPNTTASTFVTALGGPPPPAPVPTLSEWAMILLGAILAGAAALTLSRRRREA